MAGEAVQLLRQVGAVDFEQMFGQAAQRAGQAHRVGRLLVKRGFQFEARGVCFGRQVARFFPYCSQCGLELCSIHKR